MSASSPRGAIFPNISRAERCAMNIVYLHAHDAGRYVQPYGFPLETPNLMAFAKEAVLFRKAFCIAPTCGPSRAAMLTGQYPHQIGMYGLPGGQGWKIDDYNKHLSTNSTPGDI